MHHVTVSSKRYSNTYNRPLYSKYSSYFVTINQPPNVAIASEVAIYVCQLMHHSNIANHTVDS